MEPPKIGDGVFGFNFGAVHAAGAAGAAFAPSASARIAVDRRAVVDRRVRVAFATVARGVSAELEMANIVVCRVRAFGVRSSVERARVTRVVAARARGSLAIRRAARDTPGGRPSGRAAFSARLVFVHRPKWRFCA